MTLQELREKNIAQLTELLAQKRTTLRELSFKAAEAQLKEFHHMSNLKSDIARILTVMREQDIQQ